MTIENIPESLQAYLSSPIENTLKEDLISRGLKKERVDSGVAIEAKMVSGKWQVTMKIRRNLALEPELDGIEKPISDVFQALLSQKSGHPNVAIHTVDTFSNRSITLAAFSKSDIENCINSVLSNPALRLGAESQSQAK